MLTLAKNAIEGTVMGRPVHAFALDGKVGTAPPPGEYDLLPPVEDPVFGTYIIAVRRGSSLKPGYTYNKVTVKPGYDWRKMPAKPGVTSSYEVKLSVAAYHIKRTVAPAEEGFVLSKQPIPGRNCIVLASGFSDLLDALSAGTEAALTVI
jgi:hypothetical protein